MLVVPGSTANSRKWKVERVGGRWEKHSFIYEEGLGITISSYAQKKIFSDSFGILKMCFKMDPFAGQNALYFIMYSDVGRGFFFLSLHLKQNFALDIDECSEQPSVCGNHAICNNHPGTFRCECVEGYQFSEAGTCVGKFCGWLLFTFFYHILFYYSLSQDIEYSSLITQ